MPNKCKCGQNNSKSCPNCSKYKFVFNLKNHNEHLKLVGKNGELVNPVWYSILSKDHQTEQKITNGFLRRYANSKYYGNCTNIQLYDNQTKTLIKTYTII